MIRFMIGLVLCLLVGLGSSQNAEMTTFVGSEWLTPSTNNLLQDGFAASPSFELSLQVRFNAVQQGPESFASVLQLTNDISTPSVPGWRVPGIFIFKDTTKLHIAWTGASVNSMVNTPSLPIGQVVTVRIRALADQLTVTLVELGWSQSAFISPERSNRWITEVWAGVPGYNNPVDADIRNVNYKPLANPELLIGSQWFSPRVGAILNDDFAASPEYQIEFQFRIDVQQSPGVWGSLFNFKALDASNVPGSRLPGVWISHFGNFLHVSGKLDDTVNWSLDAPLELTLGQEYSAVIRTEGTQTLVWIDGALQINKTIQARATQARRVKVKVYAGDPAPGYILNGAQLRNLKYTALGVSRVLLSDSNVIIANDGVSSAQSAQCAWNTFPSWYPKYHAGDRSADEEAHCQTWSNEDCLCFPSNATGASRTFDISQACPAGQTPQVLSGLGYWPYEFTSGLGHDYRNDGLVFQGKAQSNTAGEFATRTQSWQWLDYYFFSSAAFDIPIAADSDLIELVVSPVDNEDDPNGLFFFVDVEILCAAMPISTIEATPRTVRLAGCSFTTVYQPGQAPFCDANQRVNASALLHKDDGAVVAFDTASTRGKKQYDYSFSLDQRVVLTGVTMSGLKLTRGTSGNFLRTFSVADHQDSHLYSLDWDRVAAETCFEECSFEFAPRTVSHFRYESVSSCDGCVRTETVDAFTFAKVLAGQPDLSASATKFTELATNASHATLQWNAVVTLPSTVQQSYAPGWIAWSISPQPPHGLTFIAGSNSASLSGTTSWTSLSGLTFEITATDGVNRTSSVNVSLIDAGCRNPFALNHCASCTRDAGNCEYDTAGLLAQINSFKSTSPTSLNRWCRASGRTF